MQMFFEVNDFRTGNACFFDTEEQARQYIKDSGIVSWGISRVTMDDDFDNQQPTEIETRKYSDFDVKRFNLLDRLLDDFCEMYGAYQAIYMLLTDEGFTKEELISDTMRFPEEDVDYVIKNYIDGDGNPNNIEPRFDDDGIIEADDADDEELRSDIYDMMG